MARDTSLLNSGVFAVRENVINDDRQLGLAQGSLPQFQRVHSDRKEYFREPTLELCPDYPQASLLEDVQEFAIRPGIPQAR